MIASFSLILSLYSFPDILTQPQLCKKEVKKITPNLIQSSDDAIKAFMVSVCAGEIKFAEQILKYADEKFPPDFLVKFNLGNLYLLTGKYNFAVFYLNQAKAINPHPAVYDSLTSAYLRRGDINSAKNTVEEALKKFKNSGERDIINSLILKNGFLLIITNENDKAEKIFREYIAENPQNPYAYVGLIESLFRQQKVSLIPEIVRRIPKDWDEPNFYLYSAVILHSAGYLDSATEYYILASEKFIKDEKYLAKILLHTAQRDLGMYQEAKESYEDVKTNYPALITVKLPYSPQERLKLVYKFISSGNIKGAETEVREILKISPEDRYAKKILIQILIVKALLFSGGESKIGNLEEAREIAKKYLEEDPSDSEVLYFFALSNFWLAEVGPKFARSGNLLHAISALQSAINIKALPEYIELLGLCYFLLEKYDLAIEELQKIKGNDRTKLILAMAYANIGNNKKSKEILATVENKKGDIFIAIAFDILKRDPEITPGTIGELEASLFEGREVNIFKDAKPKQTKDEKSPPSKAPKRSPR